MNDTSYAKTILNLLDLTSLNDDDTDAIIINLCNRAKTSFGTPAAICIYPKFIPIAKKTLETLGIANVKIATVINFPHGRTDIHQAVIDTKCAINDGANEIDVVIPYNEFKNGNTTIVTKLVKCVKEACNNKAILKVIIESGELKEDTLITSASILAIQAGADFIKTSTGKVNVNATPHAAQLMMRVIYDYNPKCGFKPAGGIKTIMDAKIYLEIVANIMGKNWITPQTMRFGASSILNDILLILDKKDNFNNDNS